jgi:hypothetical protein
MWEKKYGEGVANKVPSCGTSAMQYVTSIDFDLERAGGMLKSFIFSNHVMMYKHVLGHDTRYGALSFRASHVVGCSFGMLIFLSCNAATVPRDDVRDL